MKVRCTGFSKEIKKRNGLEIIIAYNNNNGIKTSPTKYRYWEQHCFDHADKWYQLKREATLKNKIIIL